MNSVPTLCLAYCGPAMMISNDYVVYESGTCVILSYS